MKNQIGFQTNWSKTSIQILTVRWILDGVHAKNTKGNSIICSLLRNIWLHTRMKDGADTYCLQPTQRCRRSHDDAI